jgi:glycopeptide antibiotics resistance protein
MFAFPFWAGQLCVLSGWILFRFAAYLKNKTISWKSEGIQILFLINLLVIYRITFHPFSKVDGQVQPLLFEAATAWPFRINLLPFVNLLDYPTKGEILLNVIGNSAMFIPTGILTPLLYKHLDSFKKTVLTGFLLSLAIAIIQLPFAVRCSDVDDLILNTLGCIVGYGILSLCRRCVKAC